MNESTQVKYVQVSTTTSSQESAEHIAQTLIEKRLAACVQIIAPVKSVYRWKGNIETAQEWLCLIKTTRGLFEQVSQTIRAIHPYETPEIIATPIIDGNPDYLRWILDSVCLEEEK
ncbi:MAG: divalent-cation tolerance protein CutA [Candidatus Marinimicrobia bacterium]|nr:divalent-cation tolerance protein CutA [Candidatus Neomarinimicrobiota bacterium]